MEKIRIEVDKVILYYMDRVDPDGNLYRFYVYKDMASEIEYFCTEEAGNMTIPIGEGKYIEIVPRKIVKIPVRGYRRLAGKWNCETCYGKGWYRLFNYFKYKPDICYIKNIGRDKNGNTRYEISLFNATMNVTRYFNLWRMKPGKHVFYKSQQEIQKVNPLYAFKVATAYFREQGKVPVFEDSNCRLIKL